MSYKSVLLALSMFTVGCSVGVEEDETVREIVHNLRLAGFPDSEIEVLDDGTVRVGGDAKVSLQASREMVGPRDGKEPMPEGDGQGAFKQYRTTNLIASSIDKICINGAAFTGTLSTALDRAIDNYNDVELWFEVVRISSGSGAGCDAVITAKTRSGTTAEAGFPAGGLPYHQIEVGTGVTSYGVAVATHVIMHELGHCVGLRHSDYFDRSISCGSGGNEGSGAEGAIHIPGTPTGATLNGSVMNACYNGGSTGEWTSSDITAFLRLYAVETTITSGPYGSMDAVWFQFTSNRSGSTFQCKMDSGPYTSCTSPKLYTGLGFGSHTFRVRARTPAGNTDATPAVKTWTIQACYPTQGFCKTYINECVSPSGCFGAFCGSHSDCTVQCDAYGRETCPGGWFAEPGPTGGDEPPNMSVPDER